MRLYLPGELGSQRSNMGSPSHHRERRAAVQVGRTDPRCMAPLGPRPSEASSLSIEKKMVLCLQEDVMINIQNDLALSIFQKFLIINNFVESRSPKQTGIELCK